MSEAIDPQFLANQLRKPEGEFGQQLADELNKTNKHLTLLTYKQLNLQQTESVLEIGFGNGKLVPELLNINPNITINGIDFSEEMVQEAKLHNQQDVEQGKMFFETADLSTIPYSDNYFDCICTINTLYFWNDPANDILELKRVLKSGGKVAIGIRPKEEMKNLPFVNFGFQLYSKEEAMTLLEKAGFKTVSYHENLDPEFEFQGKTYQLTSLVITGIK